MERGGVCLEQKQKIRNLTLSQEPLKSPRTSFETDFAHYLPGTRN